MTASDRSCSFALVDLRILGQVLYLVNRQVLYQTLQIHGADRGCLFASELLGLGQAWKLVVERKANG